MSNLTINELKNSLSTILQSNNLSQTLINELLSDEFINGAYQLQQDCPENDEFMSFARSFSETQNLKSIMDAKNKFAEELGKDGYLSTIFQYVIDAWRDIDFSNNTYFMYILVKSDSKDDEITSNDVAKANTITDIVMDLLNIPAPATAIIDEAFLWGKVAVAVHEQDKKFYQIADNFEKELNAVARGDLKRLFGTAEVTRSPLVIDLDGDGVETVGTNSNIHFDHDGNGFAENTGWASPDDGILIHDINNNSSTLLAA